MTCKCDAQLTRTLRARRVRVACALRARAGAAQPLSNRAEALKPAAKRQKKSHESVRSAVTAAKKNGKTTSGKGSGKARAKKPTSGKGSGKGRGKGSDKGTTAEAPPEKEEEEIPPIGAKIFTVGDDMYVADETKTFSEPEVGNRIIYFVSAPAKERGFYTAVVQIIVKGDKSMWLKFDVDGIRSKFFDVVESTYKKRWCFVKIPQESQEPEEQ